MREEIFCVEANDVLTENVYRLTLSGNTEGIVPGQFVNIALDAIRQSERVLSRCRDFSRVTILIF